MHAHTRTHTRTHTCTHTNAHRGKRGCSIRTHWTTKFIWHLKLRIFFFLFRNFAIHAHSHAHTCTNSCTHAHKGTHKHTHTHTYTHTHTHTHKHTHSHKQTYTHTHTFLIPFLAKSNVTSIKYCSVPTKEILGEKFCASKRARELTTESQL